MFWLFVLCVCGDWLIWGLVVGGVGGWFWKGWRVGLGVEGYEVFLAGWWRTDLCLNMYVYIRTTI